MATKTEAAKPKNTLAPLPIYVWEGVDKRGKVMKGEMTGRTLAITFKAGVPLVEALDTVSGATGSETYRKAVLQMKDDVSVGYQVNLAMKQTNLFPHAETI